ncbi:hypothetical protein [Streptomyces sp. NPDC005989]|uniref:hypothetical protein n=1 Tax=Streptomyces sp. NPDC005989 TaxID=3156727 RepID=UPI0033EE5CA7
MRVPPREYAAPPRLLPTVTGTIGRLRGRLAGSVQARRYVRGRSYSVRRWLPSRPVPG